jgi:YidC/Oxa1 family membrane protein insertase
MKNMKNPWEEIDLEIYESHMRLDSVMQLQAMNAIMKYFFPLSILWLARSYPAGLAIYWAGGQFMQIFFNLRINKIRDKMNEEKEKRKLVERAEKELARKKRARMKGSY